MLSEDGDRKQDHISPSLLGLSLQLEHVGDIIVVFVLHAFQTYDLV
jgi:hypothetical protein